MEADLSQPAAILVVDDNAQNRALVAATLEDEGYRVVAAASGEEGIGLFERDRPEAVVLDVRMPGLDGFEVCARIRALPGGPETPILFLTALRDLDTFEQALRAGGDDFLTKPVRPAELVIRIQTALRLRRVGAEVKELYALVLRQRDDLMRAVLHKERLTAFLVHDLRNPVTGMKAASDLILADKTASPRSRAAASRIGESAQRLSGMIGGLLDISKSDEGQLAPVWAPVDLAQLVGDIFEALAVRAAAVRVQLVAEADRVVIEADAALLRRAIENIVENALRYAPPDSAVRVSVASAEPGVALRIADAGVGVPEALRTRIFERYVQAEPGPPGARVGYGLGLAFCKLVVEAHGGQIRVEDGAPGAVFCMDLPRTAPRPSPSGPEGAPHVSR